MPIKRDWNCLLYTSFPGHPTAKWYRRERKRCSAPSWNRSHRSYKVDLDHTAINNDKDTDIQLSLIHI